MQFPQLFEGPGSTLFLFEDSDLRVINDQGEEALLALCDFERLLLHLAWHAVTHGRQPLAGEPPSPGSRTVPTLTSGEGLFLFEEEIVLILGSSGTEARVPWDDLAALIEHLKSCC